MELKEIQFAVAHGAAGWMVVQASELEQLRELAAAAQTVTRDWPQVVTDEDMSGTDAVDWIGSLYRQVAQAQGMNTEQVDPDDVAEWVGLHYGKDYNAESNGAKAEWIRRYQEAHQQSNDE
ncbi:MAG: hypothetical protein E6Q40_14240 [Cupriavidus sp.]|nr:MAG: hypothetical protein E6Q40_14240 [Cupriavidus sp.]